ncbi:hypothetical protein LCL95_16250 [Bacillus timonensis]|nr:hypothetical protein [Bacillus timonensis]
MPNEEKNKIQPENKKKEKPDVAKKRFESISSFFEDNLNKRTFFLISQYPYMLIGNVTDVVDDYLEVSVDTSIIEQFEQRIWYVHIDLIQTFYTEEEGGPTIPSLN